MAISSVKATINGQQYNLTFNPSSGCYEAIITAPSSSSYPQEGHYYGITLTAYDDFGNYKTINHSDSTFGDSLKLYVKEKTKPTISVTSPSNGALLINNKPTFSWKCSDSGSGVDSSKIKMSIDGSQVSGISKTGSASSYTCSYIPTEALSDGNHNIVYSCEDFDGNTTSTTITIKIDTVAPTLNVTTPINNLKTNNATLTITGTTNDITSSPVTLKINNENVTVGSNGAFSKQVTLSEGENVFTIVSTDGAGKSTTVTRTVYYSNTAPVISEISIVPNPVDAGSTFVISVKVTSN